MPKERAAALYYKEVPTPWGPVRVVASASGVCAVGLPGESARPFFARVKKKYPGVLLVEGDSPVIKRAARELGEYSAGRRRAFTVPFHIRVTPFQFKVLEALSAVPYGETVTYGEVAARVGKPGAARAVGAACGANPIPLLVPCHRAVAAGGGLGGFGGGLPLKKKLLAHAGAL